MSEIRRVSEVAMPEGYQKLDSIEEVVNQDGETHYNGIIVLGEGEERFERRIPLKDSPMEMWGYDPEEFELRKNNPEMWDMKRQIEALTQRVAELEGRDGGPDGAKKRTSIVDDDPGLRAENERLQAVATALQADKDRLEGQNLLIQDDLNRANKMIADLQDDLRASEEHNESLEQELEAAEYRERRLIEAVGRESRPRYRRAVGLLGAVAAAAAVAAGGIGLWNHHELEELENRPLPQNVTTNHVTVDNNEGSDLNGFHVDYFNPDTRVTGVGLTRQSKLKMVTLTNGKHALVDEAKRVIIRIGWDSQGKADYKTRHQVKRHGYSMDWGKLGQNRKMTIIKR